jgi:hypothetical protein
LTSLTCRMISQGLLVPPSKPEVGLPVRNIRLLNNNNTNSKKWRQEAFFSCAVRSPPSRYSTAVARVRRAACRPKTRRGRQSERRLAPLRSRRPSRSAGTIINIDHLSSLSNSCVTGQHRERAMFLYCTGRNFLGLGSSRRTQPCCPPPNLISVCSFCFSIDSHRAH